MPTIEEIMQMSDEQVAAENRRLYKKVMRRMALSALVTVAAIIAARKFEIYIDSKYPNAD